MTTTDQELKIYEKLLRAAVDESVSEKLSVIFRQMCAFAKDEADAEKTKLLIISIMKSAANDFFAKIEARIETKKV